MIAARAEHGTCDSYGERRDELLGHITYDGGDFPWHLGRFKPAPEFDAYRYRYLFVRIELGFADEHPDRDDVHDAVFEAMDEVDKLGLRIGGEGCHDLKIFADGRMEWKH